jgi:hippurate hydrolase
VGQSLDGLLEEARGLLPDAVRLRRRLHRNPELGLDLPETQRAVLEALEGLDLRLALSERSSGIVATLTGGRPGSTLLLRADMDALPMPEDTDLEFKSTRPDAMHACGHDSHTAMLVAAARLLSSRRAELAGTVKFMFQPGEEGHFGARVMIEEGLLDDDPRVDGAFAIHVFPLIATGTVSSRPGPLMASADVFSIRVVGKGGHASMPHDAVDPIPIACEIVQALQSFVTRRVNAFDPAVVTVTRFDAGTASNVVPESATFSGTVRTISERTREAVHRGLEDVARGIATAHGAEAQVQIFRGYPVTVNNEDFTRFAMDVASELLGAQHVVEQPTPAMGAEDFSYILQRVPGTMAIVGVRPDGIDQPAPCHSNRMVMNEAGMATGIALHAAVALRYLDGEKREFRHAPLAESSA